MTLHYLDSDGKYLKIRSEILKSAVGLKFIADLFKVAVRYKELAWISA